MPKKKTKEKGGRPTDFSDEMVIKAEKYLKASKDKLDQVLESENGQTGRVRYVQRLVVNLPSVAGLSIYLGVARSTVYLWAEKHKEFSDILETILAEQEKRLIENGLSGTYNSNIAKLALGKHGYSDRQELTGKDGERLFKPSDEEQERINKALSSLIG